MKSHMRAVQPDGWPTPKGYANGIAAAGEVLFVAGQVGWNASEQIVSEDFVAQFDQALANVLAVVAAAGGAPEDIARMTVFVTDVESYRSRTREIGQAWRSRMGKTFPAMALVGVAALVELGAKVEIEATAVLPAR